MTSKYVDTYQGDWSPGAFVGGTFLNVDFSHRSLVGADFSGATCKDCNFTDTDLSHADFTGADLYRSNFSNAILYAARFDAANLTRATFNGAFIYGLLPGAPANISFATLLDFAIEGSRRHVTFTDKTVHHVETVRFGDLVAKAAELCKKPYQVGSYRYSFEPLDKYEAALQRSQVYNKLKRLYRENHDGAAALRCLYDERYYLTRSWYKHSSFPQGNYVQELVRPVVRTCLSWLNEKATGYGLRPVVILRNLAVLVALFCLMTAGTTSAANNSGVIYNPGLPTRGDIRAGQHEPLIPPRDLTATRVHDLPRIAEFSVTSLVNMSPSSFRPYGLMLPLSIAYFLIGATLLAVLFASVFVRILSD